MAKGVFYLEMELDLSPLITKLQIYSVECLAIEQISVRSPSFTSSWLSTNYPLLGILIQSVYISDYFFTAGLLDTKWMLHVYIV